MFKDNRLKKIMALLMLLWSGGVMLPAPAAAITSPTVATINYHPNGDEAILEGQLTFDGLGSVSEYGFYYARTDKIAILDQELIAADGDAYNKKVGNVIAQGQYFSATLTNLQNDTEYLYFAYAVNQHGTAYGAIKYFYHDRYDDYYRYGKPSVSTKKPLDQPGGTLLSGAVSSSGSSSITSYGFYWGTHSSSQNRVEVGNSIASGETFSYQLSCLEPGKTYYIQAYARNAHGTSRGNTIKFKAGYNTAPTLTTLVNNIGSTEAIFSGRISSIDGGRIREYGFILGRVWGLESMIRLGASIKRDEKFEYRASGLEPGCLYYVQTYAITGAGTIYGPQTQFITY